MRLFAPRSRSETSLLHRRISEWCERSCAYPGAGERSKRSCQVFRVAGRTERSEVAAAGCQRSNRAGFVLVGTGKIRERSQRSLESSTMAASPTSLVSGQRSRGSQRSLESSTMAALARESGVLSATESQRSLESSTMAACFLCDRPAPGRRVATVAGIVDDGRRSRRVHSILTCGRRNGRWNRRRWPRGGRDPTPAPPRDVATVAGIVDDGRHT